MRILLMWPSNDPHTKILLDRLREDGHEIVYWVGERPIEYLNPAGSIFHDHYDAWDAVRADALKDAKISPADLALIEAMYSTESLILTMMNKRYDRASVDERKHVYYTMLAYWRYVFDTVKPDFVLYALVPHSIYTNVVYDLARQRNIPTLCFEDTWVAGHSLPYSDFWKGSDELCIAQKRLQKTLVSENDLGPELQAYWKAHTAPQSRVAPPYMTLQRERGAGLGLFLHRVHIAISATMRGELVRIVAGYLRRFGRENLKKEYVRVVKKVDARVPFVYMPLSFQPERTTSPQGGVYHDQILAVETLSAALPAGWEIFVKEHPSQWWLRSKERYSSARYRGYYERLARIPHVRLVPITSDTFELTEHSKTVAVITGTAGWEALLRGKCPLVFGIPWWRDCPGVFRVDSVESCKRAFDALQRGAIVSQENTLRYLKAFEQASIPAYLETQIEKKSDAEGEKNMQMITDYICNKLKGAV